MATILKAGNVATGAQITSDATGILEIRTGTGAGTTAITVGTNQAVTFAAGTTINGITVGRGAGAVATNTAVGASALAATTGSSSNNTAVGSSAGAALTSGARNTALGFNALLLNTTGAENTAVGGNALNKSTTASNNTALGYVALYETTTGANNTALGAQALQNNTTASNNTAVGYQAAYSLATVINGGNGTFVGYQAGYSLNNPATGYAENTFVGFRAGYSVTTGVKNTFVGIGANNTGGVGSAMTTGNNNTFIGAYTGNQNSLDLRTASNHIVLSDGDGNPRIYNEGTYTNFGYGTVNQGGSIRLQDTAASGFGPVIIGRTGAIGATTDQWFAGSNSAVKGGTTYSTFTVMAGGSGGVNLASGATAWTSASDERLKDIIEPIADAANKVSTLRAVIGKYKTDDEGTRRSFLIAQDVQAVLPEAVSEGRNSKDDETEYLQIAYTEVIPLLVAAIKELKAEIDVLKGQA
jgi:hypothetical protein